MRLFLGILITTTYGVILRLSQDWFSDLLSLMSTSFVILSPLIIGAITILVIPLKKIKTSLRAFFIPWLTALSILAITVFFNLEGAICWFMVFPVFAIAAGIGGLITYRIKESRFHKKDNNNNLNHKINDSLNISLAMLIPFCIGFIEGDRMIHSEEISIKEKITLNHNSKTIWNIISKVKQPINENGDGTVLSNILGFPKHLSSTQDYFHTGGTRTTYYEDSLSFTEKITELISEKKLVLQVETVKQRKEKIKDVQMLVGSRFFNIQEDTYELKQLSNSQTEITLTSKVLVNTPFNWYSKFWVNLFLSDILTSELEKIETILNNESI